METWHKGRVVLVGDSAFGPSFKTGQGSSMAVVGAYVLASELAANPNPEQAFAAYEAKLRSFVADNQALAFGPSTMLPLTSSALRKRNLMFRLVPWIQRLGLMKLLMKRGFRDATTGVDLDGYGLGASTDSETKQ
jgi:2-polyprenyl-6-methoxyphenol hydroxylase-like FAD-dependent oxidoreductase